MKQKTRTSNTGGAGVRTLAAALLLGATASAALAQEDLAAETEEEDGVLGLGVVTVTAQKRAENVQDVPISVMAFSGEMLNDAGIADIRDLKRIVPGLNLATSAQTTNTRVQIRGVGSAGNTAMEPSVAVFVDGVYVPRIGSMLAGLNDIASAEVLRGPQGTLFGRNASMGAIQLQTANPGREFEAEGFASYGNGERYRGSLMVNAPISDTISVRASVLGSQGEGFGRNDMTGEKFGRNELFSARGAVGWDITPSLSWVLKGDYQHLSGDGSPVVTVVSDTVTPQAAINWVARLDPDGAGPLAGITPYLSRQYDRNVFQNTDGNLKDIQHGFASNLALELDGGYDLRLISGYRDWNNSQADAPHSLPLVIQIREAYYDSVSQSHELQLISPDDMFGGRFDYVAGLYYFTEEFGLGTGTNYTSAYCNVYLRNTSTPARVNLCNANPLQNAGVLDFRQDGESYAAYTQGNYDLTDQLTFTAGVRYTNDSKDAWFSTSRLNPVTPQAPETTQMSLDQSKVTYRLNLSYKPTSDVMFYASYSTGYKSGGFDAAAGTTAPRTAADRTFNPEEAENIELGVKSSALDNRVIANATLFRTDLAEYQFRSYDGNQFRVQNNGDVRQQGVEFDVTGRPVDQLTLQVAGAYLDSEYIRFVGAPSLPAFGGTQDLSGQRLPNSPEWSGSASFRWEDTLSSGWRWALRGDMNFVSSQNLSVAGDNNPEAVEPGYQTYGARLAFTSPDDRWEVALSGQNLTDESYCTTMYNQPANGPFGLNNAATGGTVLRCVLNDPRTYALELKVRY